MCLGRRNAEKVGKQLALIERAYITTLYTIRQLLCERTNLLYI